MLKSKDAEKGHTNMKELAAFVFLGLVYLAQYHRFCFYPFTCKFHDWIFLYLNSILVCHYLVIGWWTFSLFPCPSYCEESSSEPGWARTWVGERVFGHTPRSHIAGSHARSTFGFLRILHLDFHLGCASFQFRQQLVRLLLSPHLHQHLLSVVFRSWMKFH